MFLNQLRIGAKGRFGIYHLLKGRTSAQSPKHPSQTSKSLFILVQKTSVVVPSTFNQVGFYESHVFYFIVFENMSYNILLPRCSVDSVFLFKSSKLKVMFDGATVLNFSPTRFWTFHLATFWIGGITLEFLRIWYIYIIWCIWSFMGEKKRCVQKGRKRSCARWNSPRKEFLFPLEPKASLRPALSQSILMLLKFLRHRDFHRVSAKKSALKPPETFSNNSHFGKPSE